MKRTSLRSVALAGVVLLGLLSGVVAYAHEDEEMGMDMDMSMPAASASSAVLSNTTAPAALDNYFRYGEQTGFLWAHIALMTFAWVFILPISVMLSIVRSRFTLPAQFSFLIVNALGILLITIYNATTPDLYPNNAHHKLGWVVTWMVGAQVVIGVIKAYAGRAGSSYRTLSAFIPIPISREVMAEHNRRGQGDYRFSNDSGQGTERNTESLRSQSISSTESADHQLPDHHHEIEEDDLEEKGLMHDTKVDRFLSRNIPGMISSKLLRILTLYYNIIDRVILLLGFTAFTTGIITYTGFFMGPQVFSGLAHWIKGGVFFWYGILTLGRWAGCFADIGWAWNVRPSNTRAPTSEFFESFLIFFYGSTNVFLEHLAAWGQPWSSTDLEHLSITIMFMGGGLCGMLIESTRVRELLNTTKETLAVDDESALEPPKNYKFSMNPIPALIILLLGIMMSSHHQASMVSTMVHKQWGTLLMGASFARGATYVLFYLSPPTSILPSRPPTELITAFGLMAGGMIFMASAQDTVTAMEFNDLDAMFLFTVSMGVICFLMAWTVLVIAIKGWAIRKEKKSFAQQAAV